MVDDLVQLRIDRLPTPALLRLFKGWRKQASAKLFGLTGQASGHDGQSEPAEASATG